MDYAYPELAPFVFSNQVPKHRLVAVGSIDGPWGFRLGAKLELETPKAFTAFDRDNFDPPNGLNYNFLKISQYSERTLGYRALDLQLTKTFEFATGPSVQLRLDVLNVANWKNYSFYIDGYPDRPYYYEDGDIWGVPRTVKLGFNVKW